MINYCGVTEYWGGYKGYGYLVEFLDCGSYWEWPTRERDGYGRSYKIESPDYEWSVTSVELVVNGKHKGWELLVNVGTRGRKQFVYDVNGNLVQRWTYIPREEYSWKHKITTRNVRYFDKDIGEI